MAEKKPPQWRICRRRPYKVAKSPQFSVTHVNHIGNKVDNWRKFLTGLFRLLPRAGKERSSEASYKYHRLWMVNGHFPSYLDTNQLLFPGDSSPSQPASQEGMPKAHPSQKKGCLSN